MENIKYKTFNKHIIKLDEGKYFNATGTLLGPGDEQTIWKQYPRHKHRLQAIHLKVNLKLTQNTSQKEGVYQHYFGTFLSLNTLTYILVKNKQ